MTTYDDVKGINMHEHESQNIGHITHSYLLNKNPAFSCDHYKYMLTVKHILCSLLVTNMTIVGNELSTFTYYIPGKRHVSLTLFHLPLISIFKLQLSERTKYPLVPNVSLNPNQPTNQPDCHVVSFQNENGRYLSVNNVLSRLQAFLLRWRTRCRFVGNGDTTAGTMTSWLMIAYALRVECGRGNFNTLWSTFKSNAAIRPLNSIS